MIILGVLIAILIAIILCSPSHQAAKVRRAERAYAHKEERRRENEQAMAGFQAIARMQQERMSREARNG